MSDRFIQTENGKWRRVVAMCVSCGQPHPEAEVVVLDGQVWYRCAKYRGLIYVRAEKKQEELN